MVQARSDSKRTALGTRPHSLSPTSYTHIHNDMYETAEKPARVYTCGYGELARSCSCCARDTDKRSLQESSAGKLIPLVWCSFGRIVSDPFERAATGCCQGTTTARLYILDNSNTRRKLKPITNGLAAGRHTTHAARRVALEEACLRAHSASAAACQKDATFADPENYNRPVPVYICVHVIFTAGNWTLRGLGGGARMGHILPARREEEHRLFDGALCLVAPSCFSYTPGVDGARVEPRSRNASCRDEGAPVETPAGGGDEPARRKIGSNLRSSPCLAALSSSSCASPTLALLCAHFRGPFRHSRPTSCEA
ncbi:hypothetical protein HPB51_015322 [Rhipicephalus microplus]|uniref:Uncharacterized protein n=1 Tax=Rhipicephalus microplus TaxID=6941 RepID=A0A9J6DGK5_RHIMP|nr:hypothetical protein HPB51_015322 [Rhipicephalus microplus]